MEAITDANDTVVRAEAATPLGIIVSIANSADVGKKPGSLGTIGAEAERTLRTAVEEDGYDPEHALTGVTVVTVVSGRVSRDIVVAHLPTSEFDATSIDYVVEGPHLVGRLVRAAGRDQSYGYSLADADVFFQVDLTVDPKLVTDQDSGQRFHFERVPSGVAVAGDWTGWRPIAMSRHPRVSTRWGVFVSRDDLPGPTHHFKFVLEGRFWVEPPPFAANKAPAGIGDARTSNLLLSIR